MGEIQNVRSDIKELSELAQTCEELNPLGLLGIEGWVLRSLPRRTLALYLRDFKKLTAKYFHPDVCRDELRRHAHEYYFTRLMGAMDRLLHDEFYLMRCLDDLESGGFERMRQRLAKLEDDLRLCRGELAKLRSEAATRDRSDVRQEQ